MTAPNILTVDLEEWFHLDGEVIPPGEWDRLPSRLDQTVPTLLDFLDSHRARATFFTLGWVAARRQDLVRAIARRGHEVATHGYLHRSAYEMSPAEFRSDLRLARQAIEGATGRPPVGHRAARWSLGGRPGRGRRGAASGVVESAIDVLIEEGFTYDSSLVPAPWVGDPSWNRAPHRIERPGGSILELPPLAGRWLAVPLLLGSGWALRRVPNRTLLRAIARLNASGAPAVLDLHAWELDPDPPRVPMPLRYRIAHYGGLRRYRSKIGRLLAESAWEPAGDYLARNGS
jgi:polysaccharide deacetylase family protein (PEP-CTERM system associated)